MNFAYLGMLLLLIFGFGFVIFWHELGHFLAAKWAGVKVEQFAVGFGHAMISWRKGLGFRRGTSAKEFENRVKDYIATKRDPSSSEKLDYETSPSHIDAAAAELGLGETEYRLNYIPLGGYVKMLGQDDLDPNSKSDSPRSYNNKSIGKRMVIVSAGVIMNIILAIILFTILFRMGFNVPPPVVGAVEPLSPAQEAGLRVGDRILWLDGTYQHDFTKVNMNVALLGEGQAVPLRVRGVDGKERDLTITPKRATGDPSGFLRLGIMAAPELRGPKILEGDPALVDSEILTVKPGETIIEINGQPVQPKEYYKLDEALQQGFGQNVVLTIKSPDGKTRQAGISGELVNPFGEMEVNFAGLVPRASVTAMTQDSSAHGKLQPGDVILAIVQQPNNDVFENPSPEQLRTKLKQSGKSGMPIDLQILRGDKSIAITGLLAQTKLENGGRGLGVVPGYDIAHTVVGEVVKDSAADRAKLPAGASILSINDQPVKNWYDVHRILAASTDPLAKIIADTKSGEKTFELKLEPEDQKTIASLRYAPKLALHDLTEPRQTSNPLIAARWGLGETRDLTVQFYLTLRRMFEGSIGASNAMGPIGIFHTGSKIAVKGMDWVIWFLAMISANLAVVNFLPIPIVDGGLFVFLILEKIMGKPLSPKAQSIAQIVGLALIAGVFLFVTYNDISRLF